MKLGIVIYSNDAETVWNAFRLGVFVLKKGDSVQVFLIAKGVECETINSDKFKVTEQIQSFISAGGKIFACSTCLKVRQSQGSDICPVSTLDDLYEILQESDKVLTF
ncbi:MAG TPA: DsrE family protein [Methylophilaceae bacterium]|nr:DsrE family protein [Methylophilaceae bacterium]